MARYRVKDWSLHFEKNRTRELKRMDWVAVPNRMDGRGYTALVDHPNGASHLGAWLAILEIASRSTVRGDIPQDGTTNTETCLSRISRLPVQTFMEVIPRLLSIGWIEIIPQVPAEIPQDGATLPQDGAGLPIEVQQANEVLKNLTYGVLPQDGAEIPQVPAESAHYRTEQYTVGNGRTEHGFCGLPPQDEARKKMLVDLIAKGIVVEELEAGYQRFHKRRPGHSFQLFIQALNSLNGSVPPGSLQDRMRAYCDYHDRAGDWTATTLSAVEWVQQGCPPPPPIKSEKKKSWKDDIV